MWTCVFTQFVFQHSTDPVEKIRTEILKAGIDIGGDIPDIILQDVIALLQLHFHLTDGVKDGGMVSAELLADVGQTQIGQFPDQIDGDLPGLGGTLVF